MLTTSLELRHHQLCLELIEYATIGETGSNAKIGGVAATLGSHFRVTQEYEDEYDRLLKAACRVNLRNKWTGCRP